MGGLVSPWSFDGLLQASYTVINCFVSGHYISFEQLKYEIGALKYLVT